MQTYVAKTSLDTISIFLIFCYPAAGLRNTFCSRGHEHACQKLPFSDELVVNNHICTWIQCNIIVDGVVYSDSVSNVPVIENTENEDTENPLIFCIMDLLWVPSNKGIYVCFS